MTDEISEEMVETVAKAIYDASHKGLRNCWAWEDSGLDDEHPGRRANYLRNARAALAAAEPLIVARERENAAEIAEYYEGHGFDGIAAAIRSGNGGE